MSRFHRPHSSNTNTAKRNIGMKKVVKCDLNLLEKTSKDMFKKTLRTSENVFNRSSCKVKTLTINDKKHFKRIDYDHNSTPSIVISEEEEEEEQDTTDTDQSRISFNNENSRQEDDVSFVKEISPGKISTAHSSYKSNKENTKFLDNEVIDPFPVAQRGVSVIQHTGLFDLDPQEEEEEKEQQQQQQKQCSNVSNTSSTGTQTELSNSWVTKIQNAVNDGKEESSDSPMPNSETSPDSTQDSDDDIIVMGSPNDSTVMPYSKLKNVITLICRNFIKDGELSASNIDSKAVLQRLNSLYNRDFNTRLKEIRYILENNKKCAILTNNSYEVCPGILNTDIDTLKAGEWLNDIVINRFMEVVTKARPQYIHFDSFLYEDIKRGYSPGLHFVWSRIVAVLIPVCLSSHWMLLCFRPRLSKIQMYNSMTVSIEEMECAKAIGRYLGAITTGRDVSVQVIEEAPHQVNESDCGVYTCMFARCVVYGNTLQFHPNQALGYRDWMRREILDGEIKTYLE